MWCYSLEHGQLNSSCTPPPKMMFSTSTAMKVQKSLTPPAHAQIFIVWIFYMSRDVAAAVMISWL